MAPTDPTASEDTVAREMIERIAREVDLEAGRLPKTEDEGDAATPEAAVDELTPEPEERSEEDVSRELVERIAREVDEGRPG